MPESIVKNYYEALSQGRILAMQCIDCAATVFPPGPTCPFCGSTDLQEHEISGNGTLMYVSHGVAPPPNPRYEKLAPFAYGHVMLEEGIPVQGIIDNIEPDPEVLQQYFEKGPVPVRPKIKNVEGLHILAFEVVEA